MANEERVNLPESCPLCGAQRERRVCKDCGLRDLAMCEHFGTPLVQTDAASGKQLCDNCFVARCRADEDARQAAHAAQLNG